MRRRTRKKIRRVNKELKGMRVGIIERRKGRIKRRIRIGRVKRRVRIRMRMQTIKRKIRIGMKRTRLIKKTNI